MNNTKKQKILDMLESSVANLQKNEEKINELNVFPVPDGDTGSNMLSTLLMAWDKIDTNAKNDKELIESFARGALLGARGNSGVITSQIIKGFFEGFKSIDEFSVTKENIKLMLKTSKEFAYNSVSNPVEGTILSVIRKASEQYNSSATNLLDALKDILKIVKKAVGETKEELEILKEADVVDSGAYGLQIILEGMILFLDGKPLTIKVNKNDGNSNGKPKKFVKADPNKNIGYCTEFILTLKNKEKFEKSKFKKSLEKLGDSIVLIVDEDILKVHVHAKKPGEVFNLAQKYGEFSSIKADNMTSQVSEGGHEVFDSEFKINKSKNVEELAIISVSNGVGINKELIDLGVDYIVEGGQTMNPSVEDFLELVQTIENKNILILPNNSNIILTAESVKKVIEDKNIFILPTKTIQQGIFALNSINKQMINFDDFKPSIESEIKLLSEFSITKAIRDAKIFNATVKKGDYFSIFGKEILSSKVDLFEVFIESIEKVLEEDEDIEKFEIYYNEMVPGDFKDKVKKYFKAHKEIEYELKHGGQSVYELLVFGE